MWQPQGSIPSPLLFKTDICDRFPFNSSFDIPNYADDGTPYISSPTKVLVKTELEIFCISLVV